ncbi:aminotransferase class I/II-fold pyridoxal phosphate-dependent enzyme [Ilyomonas limi]|uniref:Aminotransferase class I/II-fold pyridoxal phosphate-dependent enzyme n=1 Tax=Ilyomonas limi TaxID=2575867 RepID=A0A4U3L6C4_9BACT|nr:aminotransferase class I/II-fold pyridoxal phosphate-dependent enzyme [Ilyomonas limi]TKK69924.1 aminotransferase class I/II-fold pyridoxal phosphate-dependent enzyme [Ilyomonas limi]
MNNHPPFTSMGSVAIHAAHALSAAHAHLTPIFATSTFTFDSAGQGMARFSGNEPGYIYSRFGNPTITAAEEVIAALEAFNLTDDVGNPLQLKALLHASGQSAMATMFLSLLSADDTVLSHYSLYGGTHEFVYGFLPQYNINALIADLRDLNAVENIIQQTPTLKVIHLETPANPMMQCFDIESICKLAKQYNILVTVDNTFATPYLQQPFKYGADFVFHSTTKFLNGHGTSIGGVLVGKDISFMRTKAYNTYKLLGGTSSPFDAYLLIQGMKTLELRMEAHCSNAMRVAQFLQDHPAVAQVNYAGLPSHPDAATVQKQMRLPGAVLSFELKEGLEGGKRFIDKLNMCVRAVSLGTVDTLISHPASMSHSGMLREDRYKAGITDGLIRMSVGLENINDILQDLSNALA